MLRPLCLRRLCIRRRKASDLSWSDFPDGSGETTLVTDEADAPLRWGPFAGYVSELLRHIHFQAGKRSVERELRLKILGRSVSKWTSSSRSTEQGTPGFGAKGAAGSGGLRGRKRWLMVSRRKNRAGHAPANQCDTALRPAQRDATRRQRGLRDTIYRARSANSYLLTLPSQFLRFTSLASDGASHIPFSSTGLAILSASLA
jgi:hypothetical protein